MLTINQGISRQPAVKLRNLIQELPVNINKLDTTVTKYRKLHPNLSKKYLSLSTEVRMNIVVENVQGNVFPTTQSNFEKTANQKSLMGDKSKEFRSRKTLTLKAI